jgi:hypothetical protein
MPKKRALQSIADRIEHLSRQLDGPRVRALDESAYWHAGYRSALIDALQLLQAAERMDHRSDSEAGSPLAFPGGKGFH